MSLLAGLGSFSGLAAGIAAGAVHVLTGPDHLAAVAPLSITRRAGWSVGVAWGMGHALGSGLLVAAALILQQILPIDQFTDLSAGAEHLVGYLLLGLGCWGLWRVRQLRPHVHEHGHDGKTHRHLHLHGADTFEHEDREFPDALHAGHWHVPAGIGCVHGLAGAGALLWLVPSLGMPTAQMVGYLAGFGVAGVVAMASFTRLLSGMGGLALLGRPGVYTVMLVGFSVVTICVGGVWLVN